MSHHTKPEPYQWLAQYYDEIFSPDRSPFQKARDQILGRILPHVRSACDLACGTGVTALSLAKQGIEMFAVDLSPVMCRLTCERAEREGQPVQVIHADMRRFRLPHPVDLITCEADALNHIAHKDDLRRVARAVARALRPGGHFYFDVNNAMGFRRYWKGNVWIEKPGVVVVMRNGQSKNSARAWSDVEWFIRENGGWHRHHERVEEVCWSGAEIRRTSMDAGFDDVRAWDEAPFFRGNPYVTRGCRTIYLARKAG